MDPSVDWPLAARAGRRLVQAGPPVDRGEAAGLVAGLRASAERAGGLVREVTGLDPPVGDSEVLVIDRRSWITANTQTFESLLTGSGLFRAPETAGERLLGATTGVQVGTLLAYLAPKVLGQFDPFYRAGGRLGRLLLVAPNVLRIERSLRVRPADFRLWVCLHEETHRVQFTHAPWLAGHLRDHLGAVLAGSDLTRVGELLARLPRRTGSGAADASSLVDLVASPEQQQSIDSITAVMSVLEGHADVMMDRVGPGVIGSVDTIRARFDKHRQATGLDAVLRRLLGLDAKLRQYRDGAAFVRAVVAEVGLAGFNRVFEAAENLPTLAEIARPGDWVRRLARPGPPDVRA